MVLLNRSSNDLDRLFASLSHPHRRRVLEHLAGTNPCPEDEVLRDGPIPGADETERAAVDLFHVHLPKLVEAGYVRWDRDAGVVDRGPRFDHVSPVLRLLSDHRDVLPGRRS